MHDSQEPSGLQPTWQQTLVMGRSAARAASLDEGLPRLQHGAVPWQATALEIAPCIRRAPVSSDNPVSQQLTQHVALVNLPVGALHADPLAKDHKVFGACLWQAATIGVYE